VDACAVRSPGRPPGRGGFGARDPFRQPCLSKHLRGSAARRSAVA
jgi:hypothetical protein